MQEQPLLLPFMREKMCVLNAVALDGLVLLEYLDLQPLPYTIKCRITKKTRPFKGRALKDRNTLALVGVHEKKCTGTGLLVS
jgi:hypothetical protein